METKTIEKTIVINAPKERVWDVLLEDELNRQWYAEFSTGSHADTDWQEGSMAVFSDDSNCGIIGRIMANRPYELLSIQYNGIYKNGVEDFTSEEAQEVNGGREVYTLIEEDGKTELHVLCEMGDEYFNMMNEAWDRAIEKIKSLSEHN